MVHRAIRAVIAGLCGTVAHSTLMYVKSATGLLPGFQPYDDLQRLLQTLSGLSIAPWLPWALSFFNGAVLLGFLFGRLYRHLPGQAGAIKGIVFGGLSWLAMGLLVFPMLGEGLFASGLGLGIAPALFSLLMLLTYSVTLGAAYGAMVD